MRIVYLALFAILAACVDAETLKPSIPGAGEPAFQEALQTWLDGDDLRALEALADLARQDNRAAQIFLARVASAVHLHWHATADMSRAERIALLRRPGGLSGQNWLVVAAKQVPLASAFKQLDQIEPTDSALRTLFSYGENFAAMRPLHAMALHGKASEVVDILSEAKNLPPTGLALRTVARNIEISRQPSYTGSARPSTHWGWGAAVDNGDISVADFLAWIPSALYSAFLKDPSRRRPLIENSLNVPAWAPLRTMCERYCPQSVASCTAAGASMLTPAFPFSSPAESLLPNARYWSSPRIEADVLRRLPELSGRVAIPGSIDACFAPTFRPLQRKVL